MSWISNTWITRNDFVGRFNFPTNQFDDLDDIIEDVVTDFLSSLFGDDLYSDFNEEFEGTPTDDFVKLRDGDTITNQIGDTFKYKGLKNMCLFFILAELKSKYYSDTDVASVRMISSNSDKLSIDQEKQISFNKYNKGVVLYNEARYYLYEKRETFTNWKYSHITTRHLID